MYLRTKLILGYTLIFVLMVVISMITYRTTTAFIDTAGMISHTHQVISNVRQIEKLLIDMETGVRGFLITGTEEFLEPYNDGIKTYDFAVTELKLLVVDNPSQVERLNRVNELTREWQNSHGKPEIALRREVINGAATMHDVTTLVEKGSAKAVMDLIRIKINEFIEVENNLLTRRNEISLAAASWSIFVITYGTFITIVFGFAAVFFISRSILKQIGGEPALIASITGQISTGDLEVDLDLEGASGIMGSVGVMTSTLRDVATQAEAIAAGDYAADVAPRSEQDKLGAALQVMTRALRESQHLNERQDWLKTGITRLNDVLRGDAVLVELASKTISEMSTYLDAKVGAIFLSGGDDDTALTLQGSYAYMKRKGVSNVFELGEGLVGQAALEKQQVLVSNVPEDYVKITSGLGERIPSFICVTPFISGDRVLGVVEVGMLNDMTEDQMEYIAQAMPALAIAVESTQARTDLADSLRESMALSEELLTQQEELKVSNEELEGQTQMLKQSEVDLQSQQEELRVINTELTGKSVVLEQQKRSVELTNEKLEISQQEIEEKASELAQASQYKSEFLANMSHELRTPLNSLLILAGTLAANRGGNLLKDQVDSAKVIHSSGIDLLNLINEILDLSKIEAGEMNIDRDDVQIRVLADSIKRSFLHMLKEKGLELKVSIAENTPSYIRSDGRRIEQVIRNLMSNALKFTETGGITVSFSRPSNKADLSMSGLDSEQAVAISIKDTGVGIPVAKQKIIFEAFQQADSGTARKYGGTGLGLSISRELTGLLGGEIQLESEEGKGTTFTLYLPVGMDDVDVAEPRSVMSPVGNGADRKEPQTQVAAIPDDREELEDDDTVILIIDDDAKFAQVVMNECHSKGFKCLASATGEEGLELAEKYQPRAILLEIMLPGIDGWTVLGMLKDQSGLRHVPVQIISVVEDDSSHAQKRGAIGYLQKPVTQDELKQVLTRIEDIFSRKVKNLLVVEDDRIVRKSIVKLLGDDDVYTDDIGTGKETFEKLKAKRYDCMILDLGLPDMSGIELLDMLAKSEEVVIPPVIIYTSRELSLEEDTILAVLAESIIIKGVRSEERLLDEASLFLHRVVGKLPTNKRKMITDLHRDADSMFKGKKVLVVDDDMRYVYAISQALEAKGVETVKVEDGKKALSLLEKDPSVDLVLIDIMMPVMDGYETMKRIRAQKKFQDLPIIALTAKAMEDDRTQSIAAGANDYLPKPVNLDRLFSVMKIWLYR